MSEELYRCPKCSEEFLDYLDLHDHYQIVHEDRAVLTMGWGEALDRKWRLRSDNRKKEETKE